MKDINDRMAGDLHTGMNSQEIDCQDSGILAPTPRSEHVIKSVIKLIMRSQD